MQTRSKIGLIVLINFILPLHVLLFFQAINVYFDYSLNLSFLSLLVFGGIDLETDKRKFKGLKHMKIFPVMLYLYLIITQVGYPFINMILEYSLYFFHSFFISII
jgi:hypothetical protein